ncbi:MAG: InlB B-repeat-containing protein, partial [Clostridiales Family XIII bacterium]|nr:InlB B-repeat-containing protein [Clostridiales Family XIII bacterium]
MEGNSDVADNSVIASDAKQSNDGDGDLQAQAVPINPWSIPNIADVYTVTFKVAGVNPDKKIEVAKDELCPKQTPPKATSGEVFSGWYYEDEIGNEQAFDFDTVKITKDLTITAHFAVTGHTVQFLSGTVDDNNSVVLYSASAADGGTLPEV